VKFSSAAQDVVHPSVRRVGGGPVRGAVKRRHHLGKLVDVRVSQGAAREHVGEQRTRTKLAHLDCVLQHRTVAAYDRRVDCARDRHDVKIDGRRQWAIEAELFVAVVAACGERREVQKAQIDAFLIL